MAGILAGTMSPSWAGGAVGLCLCLPALLLLRGKWRAAALLALTLCAGSLLGWHAEHPALPEKGMHLVTGIIADEVLPGNRTQYRTTLRHLTIDGAPYAQGGYWTFYTDELPQGLEPGAAVRLQARVYAPQGAANPGGYDFRAYLLQRGVTVGLYGLQDLELLPPRLSLWGTAASIRHRLSARLMAVMGEEAGSYAAAMLLGSRALMPEEDREAFRQLGIGHILSVSGFHVGVLAGALMLLLRLCRVRPKLRFACLTAALAAYAVLTGMNAPVTRASLMYLMAEWGRLKGRERHPLPLMCFSAMLILLFSPAQLGSVSFQLTYCAMLGLTLIAPTLRQSLPGRTAAGRFLRDRAAAALGVQLGILLPQLYWYQEVPLAGLALNVLVLSLANVLLGGYWLVLLVMYLPDAGSWLGALAGRATLLLRQAVQYLAGRDWFTLWTPQATLLTALGCAGLFLSLCCLTDIKKVRRAVLSLLSALVVGLSLVPPAHRGTEYIQLSVGNADCAVLWDEDRVWVIDAGEDGRALATYLRQRRLSVDTLAVTHLHMDHLGGVRDLISSGIPIRRLLLPVDAERALLDADAMEVYRQALACAQETVRVSRGDVFPLPHGSVTVLWPEKGRVRPGQDANNMSMACLIEEYGATLLATGDLTGAFERYAAVPADLLKVAHHGSSSSTTDAFLRIVQPEAAILSGNDDQRLQAVQARLGSCRLFATQRDGAVTVAFGPEGYTISIHGR